MLRPLESRQSLAGILNSAFAEGLLSEHTHSYRLGLLFGSHLIDQQKLVGDLMLRRKHRHVSERFRDLWSGVAESAHSLMHPREPVSATSLLALDRAQSDRLLIGRHPRCDVLLTDSSVSRRHAQIAFRDGVWTIRDLGSTNGTFVNGAKVGRTTLYKGDIVVLGCQPIQIT